MTTHSATPPAEEPFRSVHTTNFPELLRRLGVALAVSTYQAGQLILLRADENSINTHFHAFKKPMGLAYDRGRLAIGVEAAIWDYRNVPDVARKLEPAGRYDGCFLPRRIHVTGDIDIHEMAWAADQLWFANTRFSCLCTIDPDHSFTPRWRPPFVSAYSPEDRCHLNGLGLRDGRPRYMTMLGETDSNEAWRTNKARGGLLMDITTNSVLRRGLSMPHSPRWYRERLWLLESGNGSLARLDHTGELITVAELPGFTRGLAFFGNLAFIGLSKIRDSALFSGIPIAERLEERICGVWVVDIEQGTTVAFLRFEGLVQEIFAIHVLPDMRFPDILDLNHERITNSYVLPDAALAEVAR